MQFVYLLVFTNSIKLKFGDRYPSPIRELNLKDQLDRWENLSSLSTTSQSHVELMWDHIIAHL